MKLQQSYEKKPHKQTCTRYFFFQNSSGVEIIFGRIFQQWNYDNCSKLSLWLTLIDAKEKTPVLFNSRCIKENDCTIILCVGPERILCTIFCNSIPDSRWTERNHETYCEIRNRRKETQVWLQWNNPDKQNVNSTGFTYEIMCSLFLE